MLFTRLFALAVATASVVEGAVSTTYREPNNFDPKKGLAAKGVDVKKLAKYLDGGYGNGTSGDCKAAVLMLRNLYPSQTIVQDTPEEEAWSQGFWSAIQSDITPAIVFQPVRADDVAIAILVARWTQCKFAVKSGGHASMVGASNVDDGITIDLQGLNSLKVSQDKKIVALDAGLKWGQVYKELEKFGIQVNGARGSDVGVGGFTTGGGISYFANKYGWGCDNVANYELVTAAGQVLNVNYTSYPDVYKALRGGGPNFGIVTRFDVEAFPQGDIFSGSLIYPYSERAKVIPAFSKFAYTTDTKVHTWMFVLNLAGQKVFSVLNMYSDPIVDPPVFQELRDIPHIADDTAVRSVLNMTDQIASQGPPGARDMFWTHTFKMDEAFIAWFVDMFYAETEAIQGNYEGLNALPLIQFLTRTNLDRWSRNGGNSLPLRAAGGPYINIIFALMWKNAADDAVLISTVARVMNKAKEEGIKRGIFEEYIYMNYGSEYQDVLKSYGRANEARLEGVAEKYDPQKVFQKLRPGYFTFNGPPRTEGPGAGS